MKPDQIPVGTTTINPMSDNPVLPAEDVKVEAEAPKVDKQEAKPDDNISKLEAMLKASQTMIGKQSGEIGALRAKFDEMSRPPAGPSEDQQLADIYKAMETGDMDIHEGMRKALEINSNLTAAKVMNQMSQQQKQARVADVQGKFLKNNPDYEEVIQSGALAQYLEEDPLADEYTAYRLYKADQKLAGVQKDNEAKIAAAKEEGAKLAKGAESAGKVLGKQGGSAAIPQVQRPFKNTQEMTAAGMEQLKAMRAAAAQ
jgi:hypothetical protein